MEEQKNKHLAYKSFAWNIGTTSFRTRRFNYSIERQLQLLDAFWHEPENAAAVWGEGDTQKRYYEYLHAVAFTIGTEARPDKAAREKTSRLADIGLIDKTHRLTPAGQRLLDISKSGDYTADNLLGIDRDSMLYLCQLLKMSVKIEREAVRPLIVILQLVTKLGYLTRDEFTYLAPLCITPDTTEQIIGEIEAARRGEKSVRDIIWEVISAKDNYHEALQRFRSGNVTEALICEIGINRKSRKYDKAYYPIFLLVRQIFLNRDYSKASDLYEATTGIPNAAVLWRDALFGSANRHAIAIDPEQSVSGSVFFRVASESELREKFFRVMHVIKAVRTLADYRDLNTRYLKLTGILLFDDDRVRLDTVPQEFFRRRMTALYALAYTAADRLETLTALADIDTSLAYTQEDLLQDLNATLPTPVTTIDEARTAVDAERYRRLNALIDTRFTNEALLSLLDSFETRDDRHVCALVTDNADVPTIFEYVLGIIWYKVSHRRGALLSFMRLSLDADLLPVTHAAGGEADIVYDYEESAPHYPAHSLLLEATLADSTNQRRMEMEPVSRHVGNHIIATRNRHSYGLFVTTFLHPNVVSDFKSRKHTQYYGNSGEMIEGMKIIPIDTAVLKAIIRGGLAYEQLYTVFETAYLDSEKHQSPLEWYETMIKARV